VCKPALIPLYLTLESDGFSFTSRNMQNFCAFVVSPRNGPSVRCASAVTVVYTAPNVPGTWSFDLNNVT
jgi:Mg2+/citrate symporter